MTPIGSRVKSASPRCWQNATRAVIWFTLSAWSLAGLLAAEPAEEVERVYVIRRKLADQPVTSVGKWAHSALLLQTVAGRRFTLEYMDDSKAHLTAGTETVVKEDPDRMVAFIKMKGYCSRECPEFEFEWERQLKGTALKPESLPGKKLPSPEYLQERMKTLMKTFSVWKKEHCHTAQERLRVELKVLDPAALQ